MSRRMNKVLNVARNNGDVEIHPVSKSKEIPLLAVFKMPGEDSWWLPILCVARVAFIPVFILCNVQPRKASLPVVIDNDYVPLIASGLLGLTNGHLGTLYMMYGPRRVTVENKEMAGSMLTFFLAVGLAAGSLSSLLIKDLIQP
ncbi:hypothetical protein NP493_801g01021 [Ridgeia piscesae]|uniref:Equilibrative nucleoside transporter n=1 Tax=Ridgeia piscesae TaxID=27915 RepID=A0AAD9NN15_RIDPI|nr:hypothetical protein NP493_801g01021 [Ridgeia piscesae]